MGGLNTGTTCGVWLGTANSRLPFFWVIRPDLVVGKSAIFPPEFEAETKERGLIASWCPQEQVLEHSSVGGFLTHSGLEFNIESLCAGVPYALLANLY
ncbi:hypothetical protein Prudu_000387 [Prunus dulcis]|uniref:UDP-Glycosyltransferase superfamily protein n=1 Tax=Prunus dulcis TaxID=3755 RepID=A0A4Y1QLF8_PRUDU|nr:hypothetical protein Prudu_000387 [Prunus dulcis]